jgi:hypothetical protein
MKSWFVLGAIVPAALAVPTSSAKAGCDRAVLMAAADAYIESQTAGSADAVSKTTAATWKYVENNKEIDIKTGILNKALKLDHRRTNVDMTDCATYTEYISSAANNPYVIGVQIHHDADMKVKLVDVIASSTGSWLFDAKKTLGYVQQEKWDVIPEGKRDPRALIKAAGDAYMDMWSNATAHQTIPWGTPCARLEGGAYTGKGQATDSCTPGIPSNHNQKPNSNRRYVIDESMGSVSIFCVWEHMMNAADSHEFRMENGKLRYIHTMTECGGKTCRL